MFYFKDAGIPPSKMDGKQLEKVQAFKKKIADEYGGLYFQFETTDEFQTKARIHLSKVVQDWLEANTGAIESKTVLKTDEPETGEYNPLANLTALDDLEADEGVIDLVDHGIEALYEVVQIVNRMGEATADLGENFTRRNKEAEASNKKTDRKAAKRFVNNVTNDIEVFVKRMSVEIPEFYKQNAIFVEPFSKVALIAEKDFDEDADDIETVLKNMQTYRTTVDNTSNNLVAFRQKIFNLPRMTTTFNQARRRAVAIMDDLVEQLRIASSQAGDIENLLERLLKLSNDAQ